MRRWPVLSWLSARRQRGREAGIQKSTEAWIVRPLRDVGEAAMTEIGTPSEPDDRAFLLVASLEVFVGVSVSFAVNRI
jgi:hypothetical protein